jgi:hypothetical protein
MKHRPTKPLPLLMILTFSWLVTYQLCDATEDTVEDLDAQVVVAAQTNLSLSAPQAPDTDPDAFVPQVQDQALVTGQSFIMQHSYVVVVPFEKSVTLASGITRIERDHSPPEHCDVLPSHLGHSNNPFVVSIQSNAPPAA